MKPTAKQEILASFFNALAHPRRQMIFQVLRGMGRDGMPYKHLQARTGLTRATLSFHLKKMGDGRILNRKVKGQETWYSINMSPFSLFNAPDSLQL
ncbi:MAG: helix-turn-helix transcriptional regulator [Rhodobacteraceae bacterium]|nr:helix-turn-helix transcriptional regulator [Paracoccaceae bacterium]